MKKIMFIFFMLVIVLLIILFNKKKEIVMINFVGKNELFFIDFMESNNFKYNISKEYNYKYDSGIIISQSLEQGNIIDREVNIVVSKGKIDNSLYTEFKVDELGRVPIMMYHGIHNMNNSDTSFTGGNVDIDGYQRTKESFINDLEKFYNKGYRMIRLNDYVNGIIDVELGFSPIVLTFDDGLKNNIDILGLDEDGNIIIDPNCAVGILESFKKKYPDYNVTATFFVNGELFEQEQYNDLILNWLVDNGYDIGNHTYNHADFSNISVDNTMKEVGSMYQKLDNIIGDKYVKIVALPFGSPYDKNHINFKYILNGTYNNKSYETISTLRVGWESDYSPFNIYFDKTFIKRIRAYDNNGNDFDIEANLKNISSSRYISDGDKNTIVIPKENKEQLNNINNLNVISY